MSNMDNPGLSLARELSTLIDTPPFAHVDLNGLQAARKGAVVGTHAAEEAPLSMRLPHLISMGTVDADVDPFEDSPEASRDTDIRDLFAVVSAFRIREARRIQQTKERGEQQ